MIPNNTVWDAIEDDEILLARLLILSRKIQDTHDIRAIREGFVKFIEILDEVIAKQDAKAV